MADIVDRETRSRMMGSIKGRDTKPEVLLRKALHSRGFRFRLHVRELPGRPDIVLPKYNAVINVNGCFWHRHKGCQYATTPASNIESWQNKFRSNVERDIRNRESLLSLGWRIATVWECGLGTRRDSTQDLSSLIRWLRGNAREFEFPQTRQADHLSDCFER